MSQVRRTVTALLAVIGVVLGFAPSAFARSSAAAPHNLSSGATTSAVHRQAADPGPGYWLAADNGAILAAGGAPYDGSAVSLPLQHPIVGIASTPTRNGYWMVATDGGIFSFGDAAFHGSTGAIALNKPIVGMASTGTGQGYWMVASDGGIFSFGDAVFHGSTGAMSLNKPIVGMASTPTGRGYWLVASDGGIFSFGDAVFHGSTGAMDLNQPIVGIASTPTGRGYWLVASDGGIFSFGDATFHGSTGAMSLNKPIVGMTSTRSGSGYWFVASDGGVFSFGDAGFFGSGVASAHAPVVGIAPSARVPATKLAFTTQPGAGVPGSPLVTQPVVTVQNAGGGTVITNTSDVTLALTTPGGATFGCNLNPVTAVAGVATFSDCSVDSPGTYTLTATDGTLAAAVSTIFTVGVGATHLQFSTQPSLTATGGTAFAQQPAVTLLNASNQVATNDGSAVMLELTTPAGATLVCTSNTVAAVAGVAHFTGCNIDLASGTPYTLTASNGSLPTAVSTGVTVSVGAAAKLAFTSQPGGVAVNTAFTPQPEVTIQDAGGNTVTGDTSDVTLVLNGLGVFTCTPTTTLAATAGVATFSACQTDTANVGDTLTATDGSLTAATSDAFTITP